MLSVAYESINIKGTSKNNTLLKQQCHCGQEKLWERKKGNRGETLLTEDDFES